MQSPPSGRLFFWAGNPQYWFGIFFPVGPFFNTAARLFLHAVDFHPPFFINSSVFPLKPFSQGAWLLPKYRRSFFPFGGAVTFSLPM